MHAIQQRVFKIKLWFSQNILIKQAAAHVFGLEKEFEIMSSPF